MVLATLGLLLPRGEPPLSPPQPDAPTWARDDLVRAVSEALATSAHLLSAGELHVARAFLDLPADAASLYARLHARQGSLFRLDKLSYAEVPDLPRAAGALVRTGFAWRGEQLLAAPALAGACTAGELRAACRSLGRPASGRRAQLEARLADPEARPVLVRPTLLLRHGDLFRRLARLFLGSSSGDLSRLVLTRLEVLRYPAYQPTGGLGFFPGRAALLAWEDALAIDAALALLPTDERRQLRLLRLDQDLALVRQQPPPPPWRARFSARRLAVGRALRAARQLERLGRAADAVRVYQDLLDAGLARPGEAVHRLALARAAAGQPAAGARLCQEWLDRVDTAQAVGLARTGRRLARAARLGWAPPPPLASPRTRTFQLGLVDQHRSRPRWASPEGPAPLEAALVGTLAAAGRTAVHAEGLLWRTLFGLLFADALFAPVPGMLPTPYRTGPLDLGGPDFVARRGGLVEHRLDQLRAGQGPDLLDQAWRERAGQAIAGVAWSRYSPDLLARICADLGGPALAEVLAVVARAWRQAPAGLPDLVVLAGPELRLPDATPARLPAHALLAEVKGPGDQLRDAQRAWLSRLLRAGVPAELWRVRPLPGAGASGYPASPSQEPK